MVDTPDPKALIARLRAAAVNAAKATQILADAKSERNRAAGDVDACYLGLTPEQTLEWQAAQALEAQMAEGERLCEMLRPGSLTERAPTQWAYDQACAALHKYRDRAEALERQLAEVTAERDEVDGLIAEYGIDTTGTGPNPTKKEQARVDKIVEAACNRAALAAVQKQEKREDRD